jgi:hypothetical protein
MFVDLTVVTYKNCFTRRHIGNAGKAENIQRNRF